jgi:hypothetical protein
MLAIEVDEVLGCGGQAFLYVNLAALGIHDAQAVSVLVEHIGQEFVGELGGSGLFDEQTHDGYSFDDLI